MTEQLKSTEFNPLEELHRVATDRGLLSIRVEKEPIPLEITIGHELAEKSRLAEHTRFQINNWFRVYGPLHRNDAVDFHNSAEFQIWDGIHELSAEINTSQGPISVVVTGEFRGQMSERRGLPRDFDAYLKDAKISFRSLVGEATLEHEMKLPHFAPYIEPFDSTADRSEVLRRNYGRYGEALSPSGELRKLAEITSLIDEALDKKYPHTINVIEAQELARK